jgi:Putative beta-lactamase-inhibitor-like, PepSY-like
MKKYLWVQLIVAVTCSSVAGQKLRETDVPAVIKTSFAKTDPGVKATWEKEKGNYEAGFTKEGKTMSATFLPNGVFMESETNINESGLPAAVLNYIKSNYKDKKITESAKIISAGGVVTFEAEVGSKDLVFDSSGKFLKAVKN